MNGPPDRTQNPVLTCNASTSAHDQAAIVRSTYAEDPIRDTDRQAPNSPSRLELLHFQLAQLSDPPLCSSGAEFLAIIWIGDRPVAQLYGRADSAGRIDPNALRNAVKHAPINDDHEGGSLDVSGADTTSVVICTRDRAETLARTLSSLREQTGKPDQTFVVDNASRSSHVVLHPRWLECLVAAFDSDNVVAVTGLVLPAELETSSQVLFEKHWGFGRGFRRVDFDSQYFARHQGYGCPVWRVGAGASMQFRRRAFMEFGHFDERLDVGAAGCCGASEYWNRILAAGFMCHYEPVAVAFHFHRREHDALARQIFAYMRAHVVALLIQFERHDHVGYLRRLFASLPYWYARRAARRILRGTDGTNRLLFLEFRGAVASLVYYLRAWRTSAGIWP